ncbi:uncharacterized protein [Diadema antillarum]|uniref:uncharacterized protein n=1 Tax=Diadema antillarum TaxID=105358 RepID=UPI003A8B38C5
MRTSDRVNFGTPISYAVRGAEGEEDVDNALTLQDYNNFVLSVNGESVATYVSANQDDRWYFITVTWSNHKGAWSLYLDGRLETSGKRLSSKRPIRGRGMFVVGQEQDSYNGSYVPKESFLGAITQVNMWDYAMDLDEILNLQASCSPTGNVLSWAQLSTGINGEVRVQSPSRQCSALDDCAAAPDYCRNGGTCVDSHDGISCKCSPGTYGPTCENLAIPCLPDNQCLNGGSCTPQGDGCLCPLGFSGWFSHKRYIMSQSDVDPDSECCKEFQKTAEKADLLMLIEYLTLVELFKELNKTPSSYIDQLVSDDPQLKVRQAATYLDPQKVAKYYPHAARVMWMNPKLMDPCMFTEYMKYLLRNETVEDLKERREKLARHLEGLDAAVRVVYRAMGEESDLSDSVMKTSSL